MDGRNPLSLSERIRALQPDEKAIAVLEAAFECFLQFGVKRTSMQDIADRAGMSRAALYLHYKNKDDIFQALMVSYFAAAAGVVTDALASDPDPVAALKAAFDAQAGDAAERMMESPHAAEMLEVKHAKSQAVLMQAESKLVAAYADWLAQGVSNGTLSAEAVGDDPVQTATAIITAVFALKRPGVDAAGYAAGRARFAILFGRALRP